MFFAKRELDKKLESNLLVSAYTIQFKLPDILRTDIIVKKPIFALKNISSGKFSLVDDEGTVLFVSKETNLPTAEVNYNLPLVGEKISDESLFALELISGLSKMYQVNTGTIDGETLLVDIPGSIRVIFPLVDADRDYLLGSLKLIYSNIRDDNGRLLYSQIDLRYKNPVLK